jgi:hypothetical protein
MLRSRPHLFLSRQCPRHGIGNLTAIHAPLHAAIIRIPERGQFFPSAAVVQSPVARTIRLIHNDGLGGALGRRRDRLRALREAGPRVRSLVAVIYDRLIAESERQLHLLIRAARQAQSPILRSALGDSLGSALDSALPPSAIAVPAGWHCWRSLDLDADLQGSCMR